ncbi:MAG: hypothetical protein ACREMY_27965, partial [bacterium]
AGGRCSLFQERLKGNKLMFTPSQKNEPPAITSARSRLSQALRRMQELANASVSNPGLEADYSRAVADVGAAEAALKEIAR